MKKIFHRIIIVTIMYVIICCLNVFAIQQAQQDEFFYFNSLNKICNLEFPPASDIIFNKQIITPGGILQVLLLQVNY